MRHYIQIKGGETNNDLRVKLLLGYFRPINQSLDYLELETIDKTLLWTHELSPLSQRITLQVDFQLGPPRNSHEQIWAITQAIRSTNKYHFDFLLPEQ